MPRGGESTHNLAPLSRQPLLPALAPSLSAPPHLTALTACLYLNSLSCPPHLAYPPHPPLDSYNVFAANKLTLTQKVFKKHPMADCGPPAEVVTAMGLAPGACAQMRMRAEYGKVRMRADEDGKARMRAGEDGKVRMRADGVHGPRRWIAVPPPSEPHIPQSQSFFVTISLSLRRTNPSSPSLTISMPSLANPPGHPVHLGTVLSRCPHYSSSMRTKWGMPKQAGDGAGCVLL